MITPKKLLQLTLGIEDFYEGEDLVMIEPGIRDLAKVTFRPEIKDSPVYAEFYYQIVPKGFGVDSESVFAKSHIYSEEKIDEQLRSAIRNPVICPTKIQPHGSFFIRRDQCISERDTYMILTHLRDVGMLPAYKEEESEPYWCESSANLFEQILPQMNGTNRSLIYPDGDFRTEFWLREENMDERKNCVEFLRPIDEYWGSEINFERTDIPDTRAWGGFTKEDLSTEKFKRFNKINQELIRNFVVAVNKAILGREVPIESIESVLTIDDYKAHYLSDSAFERKYFPSAVKTIKDASDAILSGNYSGYEPILKDIWGLVIKGFSQGTSLYMPRRTASAYKNLIFAAGYMVGEKLRLECDRDYDLASRMLSIAHESFILAASSVVRDRRDELTGKRIIDGPIFGLEKKCYLQGLQNGVEDKLGDAGIMRMINPNPLAIRGWNLKYRLDLSQ